MSNIDLGNAPVGSAPTTSQKKNIRRATNICENPIGIGDISDHFDPALFNIIPGQFAFAKNMDAVTDLSGLYYKSAFGRIDVSGCTSLSILNCYYNALTSLDVSGCTSLSILNCYYNALTALDVSTNTSLSILNCGYNSLTALDVSTNTSLSTLNCGYNSLTSLDVSTNTSLSILNCYYNALTALDVSTNTSLSILNCGYNSLTALAVDKIIKDVNDHGVVNGALILHGTGNAAPTLSDPTVSAALANLQNVLGWLIVTN